MALRDVYKISVGLFQAAPGTAYANLLISMGANGTAAQVTALYETLANSEAFQSQDFDYTAASSNTQFARQFVTDLAGGNLTQANFDFAVDFMASQLNAGASRGAVMQTVLDAVDAGPEDDPNFGLVTSLFHNRIDAAQDYTEQLNGSSVDIAELQTAISVVTTEDSSVLVQNLVNTHDLFPGETFLFPGSLPGTEDDATAGIDTMRLMGDQSVRIDFTNPAQQIRALDLDNDGVFDQNGIENQTWPTTAPGYEIIDAYRRDYNVDDNIGQNFLGDIEFDGTSYAGRDGDGSGSDGNIFLGGLGVDVALAGVGNDFMAGGGVAQGRFVTEFVDGSFVTRDTLTGELVSYEGDFFYTDEMYGGRNADFFFVELSALDATDGNRLLIDGGVTADDSAAGQSLSSQDSDWLLFEGSDDDEPVLIVLNDYLVGGPFVNGGLGWGLVETLSSFEVGNNTWADLFDIENVDASGNFYGFLEDVDTVLGGRGVFGPETNATNDGIGATAQLWIEGSNADNILIAGYDNDLVEGNDGDDLLMGGNLNKLINPNLLNADSTPGIVNDGMDELYGEDGDDNIVFEADGGVVHGGNDDDTLWLTNRSLGFSDADEMLDDGILRIDLDAQHGDPDDNANYNSDGYGGADEEGTQDQTNYSDSDSRVTVNDMEHVIATGLGAIDFLAAGANDPDLDFANQQNFLGYTGNLQLLGSEGAGNVDDDNILYANTGDDWLDGRAGDDSLSGGAGRDDFYFGTIDGLFAPADPTIQLFYGDDVDVIHRQVDADGDNIWDVDEDGDEILGRDFGFDDASLFGPSRLTVELFSTDLASPDVAMATFSVTIGGAEGTGAGGTTFVYTDIGALTAATSVQEVATLVNAVFNAQDPRVTVTASGTVAGGDQRIFVTDAGTDTEGGRNISDTVGEGYAVGGIVSNGAFAAQADFQPSGETRVLDRIIYMAYEDRSDNERVDDDSFEGSVISLGIDSYAQDRVVHFAEDGTRIAEWQEYEIEFTQLTTQDVVTITVNGVTYQLQVGVSIDGTQVDAEDGVLDSQPDIQAAFLARFADFINTFMDDDTQAGAVDASTFGGDTLVLTQRPYNGEETVFMVEPEVDIDNLSGGTEPDSDVSNVSDHELHLLDYIASGLGGQLERSDDGAAALSADDPTTNTVGDGNVLFWGNEQINRSVLATALDTHTGLDTGVLNGLDALVINGGTDDLTDLTSNGQVVARNLATDSELQSDMDDDGDPGEFYGTGDNDDDETNGNFAVHGDDLLIGGMVSDTINGATGDDRVIGSLGTDVIDGGGDWYYVREVGQTQGTATYFANAFEASEANDDPDVLEIYLIEQTQWGLLTVAGDNFVDYFQDTLQFQQADFLGTRFTVTLNDFFGTGEDIEFRHGGAGTVGTDLGDDGTINAVTTFRNFEHIRTVSGTGLAVAGAGQGNDTLDVTALSTAADVGVRVDLTNDGNQGNVDLIEDLDDDPDTDPTFRTLITVDGTEHTISGDGDDILLIDETEAAKNNTFSSGLGDDETMYLNDYGDPDVEPTVTINVETAANTDTVVMSQGRVGQTVATDTLLSTETITLDGNTAQGIREDDTLDVTNVTDATVSYVTGEIFEGDDADPLLTVNNLFEIEFVIADGNDTVIVADHEVMSMNARSDSWAERQDWIVDSYLNYDFLNEDDVSDRLSLAELRAGEVDFFDRDPPENRNFSQFNFELGPDSDTVDYSNELARILAIVNFNVEDNTMFVGVDGNNSGQYRGAQDRVDRLVDTENIVASQGESILDVTNSNMDLAITFSREITEVGPNNVHRVQLANLGTDAVFGMNFLEYRDIEADDTDDVVDEDPANGTDDDDEDDIFAVWNVVEGGDMREKVELTDAETEFDHAFYLRGGDNEVNYNELTRSIATTIDVEDWDEDDPLDTGLILVTNLFTDGNFNFIGGTDFISSYTAQNGISAGSLRIEASQDAEDSVSFAPGLDKVFILGETVDGSDQITVIIGDEGNENSIVLTGYEFLQDQGLSDDVYTMDDLTRVLNNLRLTDDFAVDDTDTILVFDDAIGFQDAPADTISLEVLNNEFFFDFDILDVTQVEEGDLLLVGDPLVDDPGDGTTLSVLGDTPIRTLINPAGDLDWFGVNLVAGVSYRFDLEGIDSLPVGLGTLPDPFLQLFDPASVFITADDDGGQDQNAEILYTAAVTGLHFIEASSSIFADTGTVLLTATVTAGVADLGATVFNPAAGRDVNDAVRVGDLDLIDDVSLFPAIIFTDASIASAGDVFNIDIGAGEFQDGGGNALFTFDPTLFTFDFSEVSPDTDLTITVDDPAALGVAIITDGLDTITGGAGRDTLTGGAGADLLDGGIATETRTIELSGILDAAANSVTLTMGTGGLVLTVNESAAPAVLDPTLGTLEILQGSGSIAVGNALAQLVNANLADINAVVGAFSDQATGTIDIPLTGASFDPTTGLLTFTFQSGTDVDVADLILAADTDGGTFAASADTTIEEGGDGGGDLFRYVAASDGADTISGFVPGLLGDNIGFVGSDDPDATDLGDLMDDSNVGSIGLQNASDGDAGAAQPTAGDPGGLFIFNNGNNGGFAEEDLTDLAAVAELFQTNFALGGSSNEDSDALLVLESGTTGTFAFYFWDSAASDNDVGGVDGTDLEFDASEITLLGVVTGTAVSNVDFLIVA